VQNIINLCEKFAPKRLASSWDNVGLIIGTAKRKATGVVTALDLTGDVIDTAIKNSANLIIVHHPPIFNPISKIDVESAEGKLIEKVLSCKLSVYAMHTNLDSAPKGLNDYLAKKLKLKKIKKVFADGLTYRIGELGKAKDSVLFAKEIKGILKVENVRHFGTYGEIKKVAVVSGSGCAYLQNAMQNGADILVTGDVKHNVGVECELLGCKVIDAGHFGTEQFAGEILANYLKKNLTNRAKRFKIVAFNAKENFLNI